MNWLKIFKKMAFLKVVGTINRKV